jgi:hypothetical protein
MRKGTKLSYQDCYNESFFEHLICDANCEADCECFGLIPYTMAV